MTPECRVRVARVLGRDISKREMAELDARIERSGRYLARNDPKWQSYGDLERMRRAGDHAGRLVDAEARDVVRAFDMDYRLRHAGRQAMGRDFDVLERTGRISFKDRASDLPQFRNGADDDAVAVTLDDGSVVLFRDRMTPAAMPEVLLHEVGVHSGMRGFLGEKGWARLLDEVEAAIARGDPNAVDAAARVPSDTPPAHFLEEVLAHWVQFAPAKDPFVSGMLGKMRAWIYRHIPFVRGRVKLTNATVRELAAGALRKAGSGARKLSRTGEGPVKVLPAENGGGRFSKTHSGILPFEQFEAEMRGIRDDWAPDEIARAYELHRIYMQTAGTGAAAPAVAGQDPVDRGAGPDRGLEAQAKESLEAEGGAGGNLIADSEALEVRLREEIERGEFSPDQVEIVHPETGERVPAVRLLEEMEIDKKAVNRLRDCAYPGGRK